MVAFGQAAPFPGFAAIVAAVDPGAGIGGAAAVALAGTDPDDAAPPIDVDVADRHGGFLVKNGPESGAVILAVPKAAGGIGDIHFGGVERVGVHVGHPTGEHGRADIFGFNGAKQAVFFQ